MTTHRFIGLLIIITLLTLPLSAFGQAKASGKSSHAARQTTVTKKVSTETTCDGALDIVPSRSVSFTRKRRPATTPAMPPDKPEKKTEDHVQKPV